MTLARAPWLAVTGVLCYDVLGSYLMNGRHGEVKKLTVNRLEGSLASGKYLRWVVDGDGD